MNWKILLLPQKRTRTAFKSNFDNQHMKPPIFAKKTEKGLNGPPFVTVPMFKGPHIYGFSFSIIFWNKGYFSFSLASIFAFISTVLDTSRAQSLTN